MILIVSHENDDHALAVRARLDRAGVPTFLLDLARFPQHLRLAYSASGGDHPSATMADGNGVDLQLDRCRVVWWRRPQPFEVDPAISDPVSAGFARNECHLAITGVWPTLSPFWVNDPQRDERASLKPYQLKLAREVDLEIPDTLITTDPARAREFVDRHGVDRTIYKTFSATVDAWRETRVLWADEVGLLDAVALAPVIFQEYVPCALDLRVTMVGGTVFASAIHSQETPYKADYRMHMHETVVEPYSLPDDVVARLRLLMDRLGLVYGAIDLRLTPDHRFVFLEVNPSGQWLFMEERTGQPITDAFVDLLRDRNGP